MVKLIIGGTGSGKTKEIVDQVNAAVQEEKGQRGLHLARQQAHVWTFRMMRA